MHQNDKMAFTGEKKKQWQREYNIKNRAHVNAKNREWAKRNPEKRKEIQRRADFKANYGITVEQYEEMFARQSGLCAVCLRPQREFSLRFAVDHSHESGKIRGLLCSKCNTALGLIEEKSQTLQRMTAYIMKHEIYAPR